MGQRTKKEVVPKVTSALASPINATPLAAVHAENKRQTRAKKTPLDSAQADGTDRRSTRVRKNVNNDVNDQGLAVYLEDSEQPKRKRAPRTRGKAAAVKNKRNCVPGDEDVAALECGVKQELDFGDVMVSPTGDHDNERRLLQAESHVNGDHDNECGLLRAESPVKPKGVFQEKGVPAGSGVNGSFDVCGDEGEGNLLMGKEENCEDGDSKGAMLTKVTSTLATPIVAVHTENKRQTSAKKKSLDSAQAEGTNWQSTRLRKNNNNDVNDQGVTVYLEDSEQPKWKRAPRTRGKVAVAAKSKRNCVSGDKDVAALECGVKPEALDFGDVMVSLTGDHDNLHSLLQAESPVNGDHDNECNLLQAESPVKPKGVFQDKGVPVASGIHGSFDVGGDEGEGNLLMEKEENCEDGDSKGAMLTKVLKDFSTLHADHKRFKEHTLTDVEKNFGDQNKKFKEYLKAAEEMIKYLNDKNSSCIGQLHQEQAEKLVLQEEVNRLRAKLSQQESNKTEDVTYTDKQHLKDPCHLTELRDCAMETESFPDQVNKHDSGNLANVSTASIMHSATNRLYHMLLQHLVGLKFSVIEEESQMQLLMQHESTGYSFKLKLNEEFEELSYQCLCLGTLERIAPYWMRTEIRFDVKQLNIFFNKILKVASGLGNTLAR